MTSIGMNTQLVDVTLVFFFLTLNMFYLLLNFNQVYVSYVCLL